MLRRAVKKLAGSLGYEITPAALSVPPTKDPADLAIIDACSSYTMTTVGRMAALIDATRYIVDNNIPGAFVECGVWRGGSMMIVAKTLLQAGVSDRDLYLFDTFEGLTPPTDSDIQFDGQPASDIVVREMAKDAEWCRANIDEVRANLASTGYPAAQMHFVKGRVEDTLPGAAPDSIALLRLDTDWYDSTACELAHLYPRLATGGIMIIDDYGHWQGQRKAVDGFLAALPAPRPFLHRIDYAGRLIVKP